MFKYFAILLIFFSCTMIGFFQSSQLSRRRILLTQYRDFVQKFETEMGYFKEPLPLMLQKIHTESNEPVDILLRHCMIKLDTVKDSMEGIWKDAVVSAYENEPLKPYDLELFAKCGTFIGQSGYQGQQGHFSLLKDELSRQIEEAERQLKIKGPLYSKAGLSIGAVLAIALL